MAFTTEAKAALKANLELELKARTEKLRAMCDAQCASLRSRLERRVNRIPASKRNMKLVDFLEGAISAPKMPAKTEIAPVPAPAPTRTTTATSTAATRKARAAPAKPASAPAIKPAPKATRGKKRPSDDGDKENEELNVPKKRVKAAPQPPATRSTRAASRKAAPQAPQVLSPKPNNSRPAPRTRRQR